jgi:hypothetical protein
MKAVPLLFMAAGAAIAAEPQFAAPFIVQANGVNLVVELMADPFMTDWNGDGLNDLVIGQFTEGRIRFYPNTGSNADPVFTGFSYLQADGADITTTYG